MTSPFLDPTGWKILKALQENARLTYAELAKQVNLTAPAVAERARKLEEAGLISGYHAAVNLEALGYGLIAFVLVGVPYDREDAFLAFVPTQTEILECHNIAGPTSFLLKVAVCNKADLNDLLGRLIQFGQTTTLLVLAQNVARRVVGDGCGA